MITHWLNARKLKQPKKDLNEMEIKDKRRQKLPERTITISECVQ